MKTRPTPIKTSDGKQSQIVASLRRQIVQGRQKPGSRLPTWDELSRQYSVSRPTLRLALRDLRDQGFIEPDSTRGMFVSRNPPCLSRYGLVFYEQPGGSGWNRWYAALVQEAQVHFKSSQRRLDVFCGVSGSESSEGRRQILEAVDNHCFAGLIMVGAVSQMPDNRWQSMPVQRVLINKPRNAPELPTLELDWQSFWHKSLDWLESRGRKRIAILGIDTDPQQGLYELAQCRGFVIKPAWHHAGSLRYPEAVGHITQLLMDPTLGEKPDALIITDDNMVEPALGGMMEMGVRVGSEVDIVAHCCWPWPVATVPQVKRMGFDAGELLAVALDMIDAHRLDENAVSNRLVSARFEDELIMTAYRPESG